MNKKTNLKDLYSEIRDLLFKMIPEKWESIYLYASVIENKDNSENGEMFFFYYPKGIMKKNPVNVYEVPIKFNIDETQYMNLASRLYEIIKQLRHECKVVDKAEWSNITISIENVEFLAEYNFDDLSNSMYTSDDRRMIWKCKYLDYPIEKLSRQDRKTLKRYIEEEEMGQHGITIYSETFYQKHIHNDIEYGNEETIENQAAKLAEGKIKNQLLKMNKDEEEE